MKAKTIKLISLTLAATIFISSLDTNIALAAETDTETIYESTNNDIVSDSDIVSEYTSDSNDPICDEFIDEAGLVDFVDADNVSQTTDSYRYLHCHYLDKNQRNYLINRCYEIVDEVTTPDMCDIEKYWYLNAWIEDNITYPDLSGEYYKQYKEDKEHSPHCAYGTVKYGYGVCQGQSELYMLLCHAAGLSCDCIVLPNHMINYIPNINGHDYLKNYGIMFFTINTEYYTDTAYKDSMWAETLEKIDCTYGDFVSHSSDVFVSHSSDVYLKEGWTWDSTCIDYDYPLLYCPYIHNRRNDTYNVLPMKDSKFDYESAVLNDIIGGFHYNTIDPYIEKGSGIRGQTLARYEDYALQNPKNTGNWEVDDFYLNPQDEIIDFDNANITGLKEIYENNTLQDFEDEIENNIVVTLFGKTLIKDTDYKIDYDYYYLKDQANPYVEIKINGLNEYYREGYNGTEVTVKVSPELAQMMQTEIKSKIRKSITLYENETIKEEYLVKKSGDSISISDPAIATVTSDGTIYGLKEGTTTITKAPATSDIIYIIEVTVKPITQTTKDLTLIAGTSTKCDEIAINTNNSNAYSVTNSNKTIAIVKSNGLISAKKAGQTTIAVKNKTDDGCTVTTLNIKVIAKPTLKFPSTFTHQGQTGNAADYLSSDDITPIRWTTSNASVADIDPNGNFTIGDGCGTATITAFFAEKGQNGAQNTIKVSGKISVKQPAFAKPEITMQTGQTLTLVMKNVTASSNPDFSSSDEGLIAKAQLNKSGAKTGKALLEAKTAGSYILTATIDDIQYTCAITVTKPAIAKSALKIKNGKSSTVALKSTKLKKSDILWISENPDIVEIGSNGKVIGKSVGTATVYTEAGGVRNECVVTVY